MMPVGLKKATSYYNKLEAFLTGNVLRTLPDI